MVRVLIVGAGPTGLTAAVEIARRGMTPIVLERRDGPSNLSRAVGVSKESIDSLTPSGVGLKIVDEAVKFTSVRFHRGDRLIGELPLNFDDRSRIWGLPQDRTEAHLRDALNRWGGSVRYGTPLDGLERDDAGVTARFGGAEEHFNYLLGADGARSTVRSALGLAYDGFDLPGEWSIADVDCPDWEHPTSFNAFLLPHGEVAVVVPMAQGRYRIVASTPDALAALPVAMNITNVRRTGAFVISVRQVDRYQVGRVFLAGDAAHCHSPAGGRGMNLGIADAVEFASRLAEGTLDGYSQSRHAAGAHVLEFSERARRRVQSDNPVRLAAARAALGLVTRIPALGRAAARNFVSG